MTRLPEGGTPLTAHLRPESAHPHVGSPDGHIPTPGMPIAGGEQMGQEADLTGVRTQIALEERSHEQESANEYPPGVISLPPGIFQSGGEPGGELRSKHHLLRLRWNSVYVDTYTITHEDGSQTKYIDAHPEENIVKRLGQLIRRPKTYGVYAEHYTPPQGRKGKRKEIESQRKRVGEVATWGDSKIGPDGKPYQEYLILTQEYFDHLEAEKAEKMQKAEAREKQIQEALQHVEYIPTELDLEVRELNREQLQRMLSSTKSTAKHYAHMLGSAALGLGIGALVWLPQFLPGPLSAIRYTLAGALSLFSMNHSILAGILPQNNTALDVISLGATGASLGSVFIPIPVVGTLIGAAIGGAAGGLLSYVNHHREFRKFKKDHPEITDKTMQKELFKESRPQDGLVEGLMSFFHGNQKRGIKQQLQNMPLSERTEGNLNIYLAQHADTIQQIKNVLPDIQKDELVRAVQMLEKKYDLLDPAKQYLDGIQKHDGRRSLLALALLWGPQLLEFLPLIGPGVSAIKGLLTIPSLVGFEGVNYIATPSIRRNRINKVQEEIKRDHPELLQPVQK